MTGDFVEDACDVLEKDPDFSFVLIGAHAGSTKCFKRFRIFGVNQLEWMRKRFEEFYNEQLEEMGGG